MKPRVLIIAEAANPEFTSVPLVGWSIAKAMREVADVHLVTQVRNRAAIERAGFKHGDDFTSIDSEAVARPLYTIGEVLRMGEGKGWTTVTALQSLSYAYFEHLVWDRFKSEIRNREFDVVHRVTPLTPTTGSNIAFHCKRAGVPFVLGPLNGGIPWPAEFKLERRREREWLSYLRGAYKMIPSVRRMYASSSAVIVGSKYTQSELPHTCSDRAVFIPENGIDGERFNLRGTPGVGTGPLRICFVGRLVPLKGLDMLIEAAERLLRSGRATLEIVGDGPMMQQIQSMSQAIPGITLHGWLEHRQVQSVLANCDVLGFLSIKEFGGGVVVEAMALGIPPLVVDYGGPSELVGPERGFKVPMSSKQNIVSAVRIQLEQINENRDALSTIGAAARAWVMSKLTWSQKAKQIASVYSWVMGDSRQPSFFD